MERIKQAIENAKMPGARHAGSRDISHVHSHYAKGLHSVHTHHGTHARHSSRFETVKKISAIVLIFFSGWLWLRLDFLNQLELISSEYINDGVKQARAEVRKRQQDEAKLKQIILANLGHCQEAAEKDKENYMKLAQDAVRVKSEKAPRNKHEKFVIPKASIDEAARMLEAAKNECQQIYDAQLKNGK